MPELLIRSENRAPVSRHSIGVPWNQRINEFANPNQQRLARPPREYAFLRSSERSKSVFDTNVVISHAAPKLLTTEVALPLICNQVVPGFRNLILSSQIIALLSEGDIPKAIKVLLEEKSSGHALSEPMQRLSSTLDKRSVVRKPITTAPRTNEATWIKNNWDAYKGKWVAVLGEQAVASGLTLREVLDAVKKMHLSGSPIVHHIK